jgi:hypothetical protein
MIKEKASVEPGLFFAINNIISVVLLGKQD